jgi:hypothetical protein
VKIASRVGEVIAKLETALEKSVLELELKLSEAETALGPYLNRK